MVNFPTAIAWLTTIALAAAEIAQPNIRYMPLGDSITDYGCWRARVDKRLKDDGLVMDFVGSRRSNTRCRNLDYDRDHEGHPGTPAVDLASESLLVGWLRENPADVISMHLGTNDIVRSRAAPAEIVGAYTVLVGQMRDSNPSMKIVIAQIIPYPRNHTVVMDLNSSIQDWAQSMNKTRSPIWVADLWTGFDGDAHLYDGLHPTRSGDRRIGDNFYQAIYLAIGSAVRQKLMHL